MKIEIDVPEGMYCDDCNFHGLESDGGNMNGTSKSQFCYIHSEFLSLEFKNSYKIKKCKKCLSYIK